MQATYSSLVDQALSTSWKDATRGVALAVLPAVLGQYGAASFTSGQAQATEQGLKDITGNTGVKINHSNHSLTYTKQVLSKIKNVHFRIRGNADQHSLADNHSCRPCAGVLTDPTYGLLYLDPTLGPWAVPTRADVALNAWASWLVNAAAVPPAPPALASGWSALKSSTARWKAAAAKQLGKDGEASRSE
jgi:hypothetical protein